MNSVTAANDQSPLCPMCGQAFEPTTADQTHCRTCSWPCAWCSKPLHAHNHKPQHGGQPRVPCLGLMTWYLPERKVP